MKVTVSFLDNLEEQIRLGTAFATEILLKNTLFIFPDFLKALQKVQYNFLIFE